MDKRLFLELLPGPAFLAGNVAGGVFAGAGLAAFATVIAILLRWKWDRRLPLMAISILGITIVLLSLGLVYDSTTYIKLSNTVGSLVFAAVIAGGTLLRPSLLRRTLGYSLQMTTDGWRWLHLSWVGLSLARAAANEVVWRTTSEEAWANYNGLSDIGWVGIFYVATSVVARRHWADGCDRR